MGTRSEISRAVRDYLRELFGLGRKPETIQAIARTLRGFARVLVRHGVKSAIDLGEEHVARAADSSLAARPLAPTTREGELDRLRGFTRWLKEEGLTLGDVGHVLRLVKRSPRPIPRRILSEEQVLKLYHATGDHDDPRRVRDRALLEVLYSAGLRRAEAASLDVSDLDFASGLVTVKRGKGDKARIVPLPERAVAGLARYVSEARPLLLGRPEETRSLFIGDTGLKVASEGALRDKVCRIRKRVRGRALKHVGREERVQSLYRATEGKGPLRVRDRVLLDVRYKARARAREAVALELGDLDLAEGTLSLGRHEPGKARTVQLDEDARRTLERYVSEARPLLLRRRQDRGVLFLGDRGLSLDKHQIGEKVRAIGRRAHVKGLAPHQLRHAIATHLVRAGVSIRVVQLFLGHQDIETTALYTHLVPRDLRQALDRAHPREQPAWGLNRTRRSARKGM